MGRKYKAIGEAFRRNAMCYVQHEPHNVPTERELMRPVLCGYPPIAPMGQGDYIN
jgi:hypothetical protein